MGIKGQIAWNKGTKGIIKSNSGSFKPGFTPWNKGKKTGQIVWNKGLTGLPPRHTTPHSEETKKKASEIYKRLWTEGRYKNRKVDYKQVAIKSRNTQLINQKTKGEKSPRWRGGRKNRNTGDSAYRTWRNSVFEKYNYICQDCGERGKYLHAHHIKQWKDFPELRYNIENGLTLCKKCHYEHHSQIARKNRVCL